MAITLSYTFTPNTAILSAQVNDNFNVLATRAVDKTGDTMTGDLKFTDATYDIGKSGATRPRDFFLSRNATIGGTLGVTGVATFTASPVFSAQLSAPNGTVSAPSYAFTNDLDCGLYRVGTNDIALATNGAAAVEIDSTQFIDSATQPRASAFNNTTQSHNSSGGYVVLTFDSEDYDVGGCHSTSSNTSRLTVPAGGDGLYTITAVVRFASNATGERGARFLKNGSVLQEGARIKANDADDTVVTIHGVFVLAAADYIEVAGLQSSGGALNMGSATDGSECRLQFVKLW